MATLNNFCLMYIWMASITLLVREGLSSEILEAADGPIMSDDYAPTNSLSYAEYLSDCVARIPAECGRQIFFGIFFGKEVVSQGCCFSLVHRMGESCHNSLTRSTLRSPEFEQKETEVLQRSKQIWFDCSTGFHLDAAGGDLWRRMIP